MLTTYKTSKSRVEANVLTVTLVVLVIGCAYLTSALPVSAAKGAEDIDQISAQESPVKEQPKPHKTPDAFTIAFMGLSLACMLIASATHWTYSQRHSLENKIRDIDAFLAGNSCVAFQVSGSNSASPMINIARGIEENRNAALQECNDLRETLIGKISSIEADIMRMWG